MSVLLSGVILAAPQVPVSILKIASGKSNTVTVEVSKPIQPFTSVAVTTYVVVWVGYADIEAPVLLDRPVLGLQEYET